MFMSSLLPDELMPRIVWSMRSRNPAASATTNSAPGVSSKSPSTPRVRDTGGALPPLSRRERTNSSRVHRRNQPPRTPPEHIRGCGLPPHRTPRHHKRYNTTSTSRPGPVEQTAWRPICTGRRPRADLAPCPARRPRSPPVNSRSASAAEQGRRGASRVAVRRCRP